MQSLGERVAVSVTSTPAGFSGERRGRLGSRDRRLAKRCLLLIGAFSVSSLIGTASSLYLASHYPLTLIALSPLSRHLILVAHTVDPLAFVLVGTVRSLALFVTSFYLGRALGPAGLRWLQSRAPRAAGFVRWCENLFQKMPIVAVLLLTGPVIGIIAGIAGMRAVTFAAWSALALVFRMVLVLELGDWLKEPLDYVRMWIDAYWLPGTIALVVLIGFYQWRKRRREAASRTASTP